MTGRGAHFEKLQTSHSVINIVPPREVWEGMQRLRTRFVANSVCGPHISFIDPFLNPQHLEEAAQLLKEELRDFQPFRITLKTFEFFSHKKSATLYLEPECDPPNALQDLQKKIVSIFPQCDDLQKKSSKGFVPHFSVAKFRKEEELLTHLEQWKKDWKPITFQLKEIYLLTRWERDPFEVKHVIPLGDDQTNPHLGSGSLDGKTVSIHESPLAKTIFFGGLTDKVIPSDILSEETFAKFIEEMGFPAQKVELLRNPDKKPRPSGIAEYSSHEEVETVLERWTHPQVYLIPMHRMAFPGTIGDCCSINTIEKIPVDQLLKY